MAQYAHDAGAQGALPLTYQPEWFPSSGSFGGGSTDQQFNTQQSILNENDSIFMQGFFDNPDAVMTNSSFLASNWPIMEHLANGSDNGGQLGGFDNDVQTIHNPAMTLGGASSSNYQTHSNPTSTFPHVPATPRTEYPSLQQSQPSDEDDVKAASGLIFMNSQDGSRGMLASSIGGSWGNFGASAPMLQMQAPFRSLLTASGRQAADAYHNHSPHFSQQFQNGPAQSQILQNSLWSQNHQQHMSTLSRARPSSLHIDTSSNYDYLPQHGQTQLPQSAQLSDQRASRPSAVRFGSDSDFRTYGYRAPNSHIPLEHQKGANLNNVPFAAQVAANGQSHMPSFTLGGAQRTSQHYGIPNTSYGAQSLSTHSSPSHLGGLPLYNTTSNMQRQEHSFHQMARHFTDDDVDDQAESDEEIELNQSQPRKRRKSHMELEDDSTYSPSSHVKVAPPNRGSRNTKNPAVDESDDDYDDYAPTSARGSTKRRKSSVNARTSLASTPSGSPSAMSPPTAGKTNSSGGGKKKNRANLLRQNLTEDEKRRNHIQSEKTRRDLIKVQYDALDILVPALKGGKSGLSRSDVLKEIVAYVEGVIGGNQEVENRLKKMKKTLSSAGTGGQD